MASDAATYPSRAAQRLGELAGVCLGGATALFLLALVSFDGGDRSWFNVSTKSSVTNLVGEPGAFVSALLVHALGLAAYAPAAGLGIVALRLILGASGRGKVSSAAGLAIFTIASCGILDMVLDRVVLGGQALPAGGVLGYEVGRQLRLLLNPVGAAVTLITSLTVGMMLFSRLSAGNALRGAQRGAIAAGGSVRTRLVRGVSSYRKERVRRDVIQRHAEEVREEVAKSRNAGPPPPQERILEAASAPGNPDGHADAPPPRSGSRAEGAPRARKNAAIRDRVQGFMDRGKPGSAESASASGEQLALPVPDEGGPSGLPSLSLLRSPDGELELDEKELFERGKALEAKFREFQVNGAVIQIHPGPVVTTYEYKPDPGIKYSRLTSLADDLCLALKAESIRIDRIAGKSTVGIEVPNPRRELIFLKEILTSEAYQSSTSPLTIAMGKLINGEPYVSDLARMPHLLMAGATGQGKSVALNSMICSILFRARPEDVRFVMIDPKTVELTTYDGIPHLMCPVVTDPKLAANALKWATREMERRYKMLAGLGVRSIDQFNAILRSVRPGERPAARPGYEAAFPAGQEIVPLPYVVVVIDELADLMMVASTDVEEAITRLAQMARAVGIHLILATQRPSVDVITGVIKANFPSRISFKVASKTDSRTILDSNGAEQLLGQGDMLFVPPGSSRLVRVHGPLITEREANAIAQFLRRRGQPVYDEEVTKPVVETKAGATEAAEEEDEMYRDAVRLVVRTGQASVSNLQRKLRLGYGRAARLVDVMEEEGIVSKADGVRPRQVMMSPRQFDERFGTVD